MMRVALAPAIIVAMVMAGCALSGSRPHADSPPVSWTHSGQPIEPEALRPPYRPIEVSGRGKREPLIPTSEGVSEPRNRRVEINVR